MVRLEPATHGSALPPELSDYIQTYIHAYVQSEESVYHLVCACPVLAPTLYLNIKHNQLARIIYQEIKGNNKMEMNPPPVTNKD